MKKEDAKKLFARNLAMLCEESGIVPSKYDGRNKYIEKQLSVSYETVRKWFSGESMPNESRKAELASLLGVSVSELLYGKDQDAEASLDHGRLLNAVMLVKRVELSGGYSFDPQLTGQLVLTAYSADPTKPKIIHDRLLSIIKSGEVGPAKDVDGRKKALDAFSYIQELMMEATVSGISFSNEQLMSIFKEQLEEADTGERHKITKRDIKRLAANY